MQPMEVKWPDLVPQLHPSVTQAIEAGLGFPGVMPVQKAVVPLVCRNYDVAVESCTGSGKTLAFLVPIFDFLVKKYFKGTKKEVVGFPETHLRAVVVSPTRELAAQTASVAEKLSGEIAKLTGLKFPVMLVSGGGVTKESDPNKPPVILVATPGRLREILFTKEGLQVGVADLEFLMLDEADRLIEGNHRLDVRDILTKLPKQRRTGLFSATLNNVKIEELMNLGLRNPAKVKLKARTTASDAPKAPESDFSTPETLQNDFISFSGRFAKVVYLFGKLTEFAKNRSIIFFNTCDSVDFYSKLFRETRPELRIFALHGQMDQKKRDKIFRLFSGEAHGILVATDVVARGIDFENVQTIIQVDAPQQPEIFLHRIGRTARGTASGRAVYLAGPQENEFVKYLEEKGVKFGQKKKYALAEAEETENALRETMLKDRDFFVKGKRALISYLRSYTEHALSSIFDLKKLDIYDTTRSFILPIVPKLKEFRTDPTRRIIDQTFLDRSEKAEFADPNQAKQFEAKEVVLLAKRQKLEEERATKRARAEREKSQKKRRSKSDRQKSKQNQEEIEDAEMAYENTLLRKLRRGVIDQAEFERKMERLDQQVMKELMD